MKYRVDWTEAAENDLAGCWNVAPDRNAGTAAAIWLEQQLVRDPLHFGEPWGSSVHSIAVGDPIGVEFEVIEDDKCLRSRLMLAGGLCSMEEVEVPPESATDAASVVRFMVRELFRREQVRHEDEAEIVRLVLAREQIGTSAIGHGIAIPHCRFALVPSTTSLRGRLALPMDWHGGANRLHQPAPLVSLVVLVILPPGLAGLQALEQMVRELRNHGP